MALAPVSFAAVASERPWQLSAAVVASLSLLTWFAGSVLFRELQRRGGAKAGVAFVMRFAPELAGLAALGTTACVLLWSARHHGFGVIPESQVQMWDSINREWPLLMSADSLFVLQGMLRLVVTYSAAFRERLSEVSPLAGLAAVFLLFGVGSRLALFGTSPPDIYHIDGPLGGVTSVFVEVAAVPPLIILSRHVARTGLCSLLKVLVGTMVAMAAALSNRFGLATTQDAYLDAYLDTLFTLVQFLDFVAAFCVLLRYLDDFRAFAGGETAEKSTLPRGPGASLAFVILPVQQLLPAYFFLCGLAPALEAPAVLVRNGRPFETMWFAGFAQVGMYVLAGALHLALKDAGIDDDEQAPWKEV